MAIYIKGDKVDNATHYTLLTYNATSGQYTEVVTYASQDGINFNLTALRDEKKLEEKEYTFVVQARARDYEASAYSNQIVCNLATGNFGTSYIITYLYKCNGTAIADSTQESVTEGASKTFSVDFAPDIDGYTCVSVSPSGEQTINENTTVTYTYEAVEVPDEPDVPEEPVTPTWNEVSVVWETGTTSDDEKGTMGNKVNNTNRTRSSAAIVGDIVRLESHEDLKIWYNIFDNSGNLVGTSGTSLYMPNGTRTVNVKNVGGTQIWPIYKVGDNGNTPLTTEHLNSLKVYTITGLNDLQNIAANLEQGTFADSDGSKQDSTTRVRTAQRISVPSNATGIFFLPTGTIDLWLKGYSAASGGTVNFNGIKGGQYWNTSYSGILSLTWEQMSVSRPNYIDCVFKAGSGSGTLVPGDLSNVIVGFAY